ncbi:hypothetical protein Cri9333_4271 [Crinalium epipsammum PCC 9333]|uniref:Uncharacterized protein n=1 Tax=Crinalium epipsammum PCC 9333 TaxID=1173022 RepID=K9W5K8_9CYAN|nr:hypothetical protein [Crinalium epipsammum]AFZ15059.1 hypothetical protein Cri9333_4271 [Crinalium epipsammum PCC 9333]
MSPSLLRQLWVMIESTQAHILLKLDDASLVQWLLKQLNQERSLDYQEVAVVSNYIQSRISLIRDLAYER